MLHKEENILGVSSTFPLLITLHQCIASSNTSKATIIQKPQARSLKRDKNQLDAIIAKKVRKCSRGCKFLPSSSI